MSTDAVLRSETKYDISLDENGDILTADFFDTSILYSLFGERRADGSQIQEANRRRGWIGNENKDHENGSLLWLYQQERVTTSVLRAVEDDARKCLQWLVDDGYAVSVDEVQAQLTSGLVRVQITIRRSLDKVTRRFYELWTNTGAV